MTPRGLASVYMYHLRTLVLGVDNDRIRPTPSNRAIGYAPIRYSRAIGYAPIRYTIWV